MLFKAFWKHLPEHSACTAFRWPFWWPWCTLWSNGLFGKHFKMFLRFWSAWEIWKWTMLHLQNDALHETCFPCSLWAVEFSVCASFFLHWVSFNCHLSFEWLMEASNRQWCCLKFRAQSVTLLALLGLGPLALWPFGIFALWAFGPLGLCLLALCPFRLCTLVALWPSGALLALWPFGSFGLFGAFLVLGLGPLCLHPFALWPLSLWPLSF